MHRLVIKVQGDGRLRVDRGDQRAAAPRPGGQHPSRPRLPEQALQPEAVKVVSSHLVVSSHFFMELFLPSMWTIEVQSSDTSEAVISIMKPFNSYFSKQKQQNTVLMQFRQQSSHPFYIVYIISRPVFSPCFFGSCPYLFCPTHIISQHLSSNPPKPCPHPPSPTPSSQTPFTFLLSFHLLSFCLSFDNIEFLFLFCFHSI